MSAIKATSLCGCQDVMVNKGNGWKAAEYRCLQHAGRCASGLGWPAKGDR